MTDNPNEVTVDSQPGVMKNGAVVGLALEQAFGQS